uniref:Protein kinase domain-containing protein n=1 Tax=Chlamydomonas leiostraca TaxID=1034604 RepID=A0A7S0RG56_9CHLO|mmetsp:Transcript_21947/g.55866  ORF Transcript_21947/g.55866 Transcript_21947/m.55866 type:complete len:887 (+) Transcript_21947:218-2878(+)|eukprot:CAMPEP_0202857418 /NCGR_PEP_ID=MMETSP1391-20130828/367_1 /ASSEMBLY_ACC=CAM_ASM_000867 /TAXON_ID=1034604 /ORGANISM="Chlamydomonas leiostraca, Strain SAG 11-49" /LENGTH=886 /DNA_ID=CAMNT_0049536213 /DNA_START=190 /DNA_END=2850 /DNA_ORIENTATION=-
MEAGEGSEARVKLRLYYGGAFEKVPESGDWRYVGGQVHNDTCPVSYKYADLARRLNDKFSDTVSFKYQAPGEELDPDSLVAVTDDDDLQELYDEYFGALQRPGTPLKTFRIKVYVFPALIFETMYEGHETEEMEASMGGQDAINFESWCSEDLSFSSNPSCHPSSDTEVLMAQARLQQQQQAMQAQLQAQGAAQQGPLRGVQAQQAAAAGAVAPMQAMDWLPRLEHDALHNINQSVQLRHFSRSELLGVQPPPARGFTAEDFDVDDPYNEPDEAAAAARRLLPRLPEREEQEHNQNQQEQAANGQPTEGDERIRARGEPLYNRPLDRVRDAASGLPSHISAFGDSSKGSGGGAGMRVSNPGSVRLPSHISAFGEGMDEGVLPDGDEAREAERAMMQRMYGGARAADDGAGFNGGNGGKCITQEFGARSNSMLGAPDGNGGFGALDLAFQPPCGDVDMGAPTPKLLLDSVPHVPRDEVHITHKIGEGAFGEVSRAEVFPYGSVAIKWLKRDRFAKYSESFQREAEVLARLNHPNIIRMFGLVTEPAADPACGVSPLQPAGNQPTIAGIMMEYVRGGSLAQRFRAASNGNWRLSLRERCRIALQAALGMSYLHDQSPAVIHFDLKPDNLLVEGEGDDILVKVADFGLSKHKFNNYVTCHDLRGTLPYMAPELVANPTKVCEKCDVWSMGVVMWEMVTLEVPFQELTAQQILMGLMNGSLHLSTPASCEPEWRGLIEACMETNPQARPTFKQLATSLERLARSLAASHQAAQQQAQAQQAAATQQAQAQAAANAVAAAAVAAHSAHVQQQQQQQQHFQLGVSAHQQLQLQQQQQQQAAAKALAMRQQQQQGQLLAAAGGFYPGQFGQLAPPLQMGALPMGPGQLHAAYP